MSNPISVELVLDDNNFVVNLKRNGQVLNQLTTGVERADRAVRKGDEGISKYAHGIRGLAVDISLVHQALLAARQVLFSWQESIIKANAQFEKSGVLMEGMEKSTDATTRALRGQAQVHFMIQKAMSNPFGIEAIQDSMVKLKSVGLDPTAGAINAVASEMDKLDESSAGAKNSTVNIQALFDAVARFGGSEEQLKRASIAIQQMAGKGVISMEELRQQLGEAIPNAVTVLADAVGTSYQELVKQIALGRVQAKPALMLMFQELEAQVGGSAERMMETWDGMLARFMTSLDLFKKGIGDAGYMDALKRELQVITDFLSSESGMQLAQDIGQLLTMGLDGFQELREFIAENKEELAAFGEVAKVVGGTYIAIKLLGGLNAMRVSLGSLLPLFGQARQDLGMLRLVAGSFAGDMARATGAMGKARTMMGLLSIATGALTGPIGILLTALGVAASVWLSESESISENTQELIDNAKARGTVTEATLADLRAQQSVVVAEREELKRAAAARSVEFQEQYGARAVEMLQQDRQFQAMTQQIQGYNDQLREMDILISDGVQGTSERAATRAIQAAQRAVKDGLQPLRDEYNQVVEDTYRAQLASKDDEVRKAARLEMDRLQADMRRAEIALWEEQEKAAQSAYERIVKESGASSDAAQRQKATLTGVSQELQRLREQAVSTGASLREQVFTGGGDGGDKNKPKIETKLAQLQAKLVQIKSEIAGVSRESAKARGALDAVFPDADPAKRARYVELSAAVDLYKSRLDLLKGAQKEIAKGGETLGLLARRNAEDLAYAQERLANPDAANTSARMRTITAEVSRLRDQAAQLREVAESWEDGGVANALAGNIERLAAGYELAGDNLRKAELTSQVADIAEASRQWEIQSMRSRDQLKLAYQEDMESMSSMMEQLKEEGALTQDLATSLGESMAARTKLYAQESKSSLEQLADDWADITTQMDNATVSWAQSGVDALTDFVMTGKASFSDLAQSVVRDLIKIQIQAQLSGLLGQIGGSLFGGGAAAPSSSYGIDTSMNWGNANFGTGTSTPLFGGSAFANGGIMTAAGALPLRKYANGGVARTPQLALYGEGSKPEAYVPLPDGRTIPVTLQGSGDATGQPSMDVQFNLINQSGQQVDAQESGRRFDGKQLILDVVLKAASTPGTFRSGLKEAVRK